MKTATKLALGLAGTAAAAGAGILGFCNLIDGLLVDTTKSVPENLSKTVSGEDESDLSELRAKNNAWLENYGYERHYIYSDRGERLTGYLLKPEKPSKLFMFGSHGYKSSGRGEFNGFAQYYIKKGFNVFLCDHTSAGESEGRYAGFGAFEHIDCLKWLKYLCLTFGSDIVITLHGVSMGAATVMMMSSHEDLPEHVKIIVEDCGYTSAWNEFYLKAKELKLPGTDFLMNTVNEINKRKVGYDFKEANPLEAVKSAKVPMLFVHGSGDTFVPFFMVHELYEAYGGPYKDLLVIEGAGHARCSVLGWEDYEKKLDEFLDKFVFSEINA